MPTHRTERCHHAVAMWLARTVNHSVSDGAAEKPPYRTVLPSRFAANRAAAQCSIGLRSGVVADLADMVLRVELQAERGDKLELDLEKVDVRFFGLHQPFEQIARNVILHRVALRRRF